VGSVGAVSVSFEGGAVVPCAASPGNSFLVTFLHEFGSVALMTGTAGVITVTSVTAGSRVSYGDQESNQHDTWDADKIYGCYCDGALDYTKISATSDTGYFVDYKCAESTCCQRLFVSCSNRFCRVFAESCPFGHDINSLYPIPGPNTETMVCSMTSGSFTLTFRGLTTAALSATAAVGADLVTALEALARCA
jgi:hypothetical protein